MTGSNTRSRTKAETSLLRMIDTASICGPDVIRFRDEGPVKALLAAGKITFCATAYGAGVIRRSPALRETTDAL